MNLLNIEFIKICIIAIYRMIFKMMLCNIHIISFSSSISDDDGGASGSNNITNGK